METQVSMTSGVRRRIDRMFRDEFSSCFMNERTPTTPRPLERPVIRLTLGRSGGCKAESVETTRCQSNSGARRERRKVAAPAPPLKKFNYAPNSLANEQ